MPRVLKTNPEPVAQNAMQISPRKMKKQRLGIICAARSSRKEKQEIVPKFVLLVCVCFVIGDVDWWFVAWHYWVKVVKRGV